MSSPWQATSSEDRVDDVGAFAQNLVVPESRDREALRLEPSVARGVAPVIDVLRAIAFDDELAVEADEVDNEVAERNLSAPFRLGETSIAQ